MRLCILIVALVMLVCASLTVRTEPVLYLPSLAKPAALHPTTAPASPTTRPISSK